MTTDEDSERAFAATKVVVANLSGVVLGIVTTAIRQQPDMVVAYSAESLIQLTDVARNEADVLIVGAPYAYPPPTVCHDLWRALPTMKVLVLTPNGDAAVMYWLAVKRHRLKTVSTTTLIDSIRRIQTLEPMT